MGGRVSPGTATTMVAGSHSRKRRRRRWILAIAVVLVVIVVGAVAAVGAYVGLSSEPPLALSTSAAAVPVGPLDGTWSVATGSIAGFRIQQTVLGMSGDVVGRTNAVTGNVDVAGDQVTGATVSVDLTTVTAAGKASPQFVLSLQTGDYPTATITLAQPVRLTPAFASGETMTTTAAGQLSMHGASRPVTLTVSGRRDGSALEIVGSIPVIFSDWRIEGPRGYGVLGSLADRGVAEFRLVLHRG